MKKFNTHLYDSRNTYIDGELEARNFKSAIVKAKRLKISKVWVGDRSDWVLIENHAATCSNSALYLDL